jgi:uncharacterized protein YggE
VNAPSLMRATADVLAAAAGVRIAGVRSIAELGQALPMPRFRGLAAADVAPETPIEAGRTEVLITIDAVFDVEPA